jgi:DNA processing protein
MTAAALDVRERLDRLRLHRTDGIGPVTFHDLLRHFGSAREAIAALPALARSAGRKLRSPSADSVAREVTGLEALGGHLLVFGDHEYPAALASLPDAPPVLWMRGDPAFLARPTIAIVGARNASAAAVKFATHLALTLGDRGLVVVSGLARGVDGAAHRGALETGTIAVMAGGIDVVYPPQHRDLLAAIAERGLVVSEMPLGTEPRAAHFPQRNRIISGLALGVVVIEAATRSGSLITARLANEQGRQVFAVPGSPLDARCQGSNDLLRQGATLCTSADDVVEAIAPMVAPAATRRDTPALAVPPPGAGAEIFDKLGPTAVDVDELVRQCALPAPIVLASLLELEVAGQVARVAGNRFARIT